MLNGGEWFCRCAPSMIAALLLSLGIIHEIAKLHEIWRALYTQYRSNCWCAKREKESDHEDFMSGICIGSLQGPSKAGSRRRTGKAGRRCSDCPQLGEHHLSGRSSLPGTHSSRSGETERSKRRSYMLVETFLDIYLLLQYEGRWDVMVSR